MSFAPTHEIRFATPRGPTRTVLVELHADGAAYTAADLAALGAPSWERRPDATWWPTFDVGAATWAVAPIDWEAEVATAADLVVDASGGKRSGGYWGRHLPVGVRDEAMREAAARYVAQHALQPCPEVVRVLRAAGVPVTPVRTHVHARTAYARVHAPRWAVTVARMDAPVATRLELLRVGVADPFVSATLATAV